MSVPRVAPGLIRLNLLRDDAYGLLIPISRLKTLSFRPAKYLRFLAWVITGLKGGDIALLCGRGRQKPVDDGEELTDRGIYQFRHALAINTVGALTDSTSGDPNVERRDPKFKEGLRTRDVFCAFTRKSAESCQGAHIIPFSRGHRWLEHIRLNRPHEGMEGVDVRESDDLRNGWLINALLHGQWKGIGILSTPNPILGMDDVPSSDKFPIDANLHPGIRKPIDRRFTLQWLGGNEAQMAEEGHNIDAAFSSALFRQDGLFKTAKLKKVVPSSFLSHYEYAATAIKVWGVEDTSEIFTSRQRVPKAMPLHAMGPSKRTNPRKLWTMLAEGSKDLASSLNGKKKAAARKMAFVTLERAPSSSDDSEVVHKLVLQFSNCNTKVAETQDERSREAKSSIVGWIAGVEADS
ncbi:hypothetical protein B0H16DRAFT_1482381 [Mycena metata]|uniref:HNH nuclease domain-containing protein n=1 Tax=Mycena metata TaxID=1033252 RepID=A0AAD7M820_9AGAR|nr:hypothetical protein B0H16DRAFT_1482381 [Mycena metata]